MFPMAGEIVVTVPSKEDDYLHACFLNETVIPLGALAAFGHHGPARVIGRSTLAHGPLVYASYDLAYP
jgi:hypothetical protein